MKKILIAAAALIVSALPAVAQQPIYRWTGFYIGANAGSAWSHSDTSTAISCPAGSCGYNSLPLLADLGAAGTGRFSSNGFTGGGQLGYNWQNGAIVTGFEADFNAFKMKRTRVQTASDPIGGANFLITTAAKSDWLFTARGRLGWAAMPRTLLYVTGGLALTDLGVSNAFADDIAPPEVGSSSRTVTKAGWTLGAGAEWALASNWSAKAEYLYVDFGSVSTSAYPNYAGNPDPNLMVTSAKLNAHIARVGLNYRFGGP